MKRGDTIFDFLIFVIQWFDVMEASLYVNKAVAWYNSKHVSDDADADAANDSDDEDEEAEP